MLNILKDLTYQCRVSSVLNKNNKLFGKHHMFDGCEDTCWNSDQGSPQWIMLDLGHSTTITGFALQFQGGFVGHGYVLEAGMDRSNLQTFEQFHPEDVNSLQTFTLSKPVCASIFKFIFNSSSDFFGRVVLYKMELYGE